jgi:DNA-directed RNA polymerases I and III subunit RPAC1
MLAHRLGLVPLLVDPRPFVMVTSDDEPETIRNTVKLRLKARCDRNPKAPRDGIASPDVLYSGATVLSGSIEYVPFEGPLVQVSELGLEAPPCPVHDDIILAKMRPGERIHVEMDAVLGIGQDHAKFSPSATTSYRMLPEVSFKQPVDGSRARELVALCPAKVFDIEDVGGCAVVARPRDCTMCRECIRDPDMSEFVQLERKRNHFIYSVESTGALPSGILVTEALSILSEKCRVVEAALDAAMQRRQPSAEADFSDDSAHNNKDRDMDISS